MVYWLGGGILNSSVALAADDAAEDEADMDNPYSYNNITFNADSVVYNGRTFQVGEEIKISHNHYITYHGSYSATTSGSTASGNISNNILTINGGEFHFNINGGNYTGNFRKNTISFNGGTLELNLNDASNFHVNVRNNTFAINGGTFSNVYTTMASDSTATGNTFNLSGSPDISNAYIYAGFAGVAGSASDNTLNVYSNGLTAQNIYDFDSLNFYLPASTVSGDTMLTLTNGATDISGADISAYISGGSTLTTGDTVNLLTNSNGITTSSASDLGNIIFDEGVTLQYDAEISGDGNNVVLTLGDPIVQEKSLAPAQAVENTSSVLSQGTDRLIEWLPPDEFEEAMDDSGQLMMSQVVAIVNKSFGVFASMDGRNFKTKTGNGSYIKSHGAGIDLGFARAVESQRGGSWIFAPVVDYGKTSFDSYLGNGLKGDGDSKYFAGGLIGRRMQRNGFYIEGSFRGGSSKTNFSSADLAQGTPYSSVGYSATAPVFAGHIRVGRLLRLNKNNIMHVYGIYAHNHINGFSADLTSGEHYDFDSVDSGKFQIGYRLTSRVSTLSRLYTGIAYQYEINGSSNARYKSFTTPSAKVKGSSAMLELGWQMKANKASAWMVDFNVSGWAGIQKGVTGSAKFKKSF